MSDAPPILTTRLMPRIQRARLVQRQQLLTQLDAVWQHPLTLVCAPAGFGKTTLLVQWIQQQTSPVIWLTLEESDTLQVRFWQYFITALQSVRPGFGRDILQQIQSMTMPSHEVILHSLLNALAELDTDIALVLDDYHVLPVDAPIHTALGYLIKYLPEHIHLIIASRSDPLLPLARLRARGQLLELCTGQLRFSFEESQTFFDEKMNLPLSADDLRLLLNRTEGWVAGMQMAALWMHGQDDLSASVRRFSGDHRYILDYLNDEVIAHQPEHVRDFLLRTAVLRRLDAGICQALTDRDDCQHILEQLERDNLFLIALDDQRQHYRFHHLLSDLLRRKLSDHPGLMQELYHRAAVWYEAHDCLDEATEYALNAGDFDHAARLLESGSWINAMRRGDAPALVALIPLMKRFPPAFLMHHPWLIINQATALMATTQYREAEALLDDLEAQARIDDQQIQGGIAAIRAVIATMCYRPEDIIQYAERAFALLAPDASAWLGLAAWAMAHSHRQHGDSARASQAFELMLPWLSEDPALELVTRANHAEQLRLQARLHEAHQINRALIAQYRQSGFFQLGVCYVFGSEILREWNQVDEAVSWAQQGFQRARSIGSLELLVFGGMALARCRSAQGDGEGALAVMDEILGLHNDVPHLQRQVLACQAALNLDHGRLDAVQRWVQARTFDLAADVPYLEEYEHSIYARWLLHRGDARAALRLLESMAQQAEAGGRINDLIAYRVLQTLAHSRLSAPREAQQALMSVLPTALAQGYTRVFMDAGRPVAEALAVAAAQVTLPAALVESVRRMLDPQTAADGLAEPLTERELEVLRLLAAGFSNQQVAENLTVSVNTVKTHIKHLYEKFDVNNRVALIEQARTVNIL